MNILCIIDFQNDFIAGALGSLAAKAAYDRAEAFLKARISDFGAVFVTRDTHEKDTYPDSYEGKRLPVPHCIAGTEGHEMPLPLQEILKGANVVRTFDKISFGEPLIGQAVADVCDPTRDKLFLMGLDTDICVLSNAILIRASNPELPMAVFSDLCAGSTEERHIAALSAMHSCFIDGMLSDEF